ncbi:hypothetical protein H5410_009434 [Solanum commersonii]|uniref:Uncharacterized protein n=1 Tax=Solanum commersonii TaxID=4109 RepID=A0A9J6AI05_SOLCO|nr:hypothetical protein H5410_009434 [Solanum commersonii]
MGIIVYSKNSKRLYRRLVNLKSASRDQERFGRAGFMGLFGQRVDLLDHYEKKLEVIEDHEVGAAFVSFRTCFAAASAIHMQQGVNPIQWVTEPAPDPEDVYWPFFSASFLKRWISNLVVVVACVLLTLLFLIPVLIVQGLTHLEQLEIWFPFLKGLLRMVHCYEPDREKCMHQSSLVYYMEHFLCKCALWIGSYRVDIFLEPKNIPAILAVAVPGQLLNVYAPKYETGGKLWPIVHDSMIFSLILMHVIAIGIFGLKKFPLASSLTVPLPILTLVFNSYCRGRFLPMFKSYSIESSLKKDKEEQNDPTIASFHERLATAYQDPALLHVRYSGNSASIIARAIACCNHLTLLVGKHVGM